MHAGSVTRPTAARRVLRFFRANRGRWMTAHDVFYHCDTTCPSTRISEVNRQIAPGANIECQQRGDKFFYRYRRLR